MKRSRSAADSAGAAKSSDLAALELGLLIQETKLGDAHTGSPLVRAYLFALRACLVECTLKTVKIKEHSSKFESLPVRRLNGSVSASLEFLPPTSIDVCGSYLLQTASGQSPVVDVAVQMPSACFTARDVKNFGYADKRAMYLGVLADSLQSSGLCASVCASALGQDASKPCLLLVPAKGFGAEKPAQGSSAAKAASGKRARAGSADSAASATGIPSYDRSEHRLLASIRVRIIPTLEEGAVSINVLRPAWNNVRPWVFEGRQPDEDANKGAAAPAPHTPRYNASVAEDLHVTMRYQLAALHEAFTTVPAARDAVLALKLWARRRGWHAAPDGISGHVLACLVAYLVQQRIVQPGMTCIQVTRTAFAYIASTDLTVTPLVLRSVGSSEKKVAAVAKAPTAEGADIDGHEDEEDDFDDDVGQKGYGDYANDDDDDDKEEEEEEGKNNEDDEQQIMEGTERSGSSLRPLVEITPALLAEHHAEFPVVILCPTGLVNIAWRVGQGCAADMRRAAVLGLQALGSGNSTSNSGTGMEVTSSAPDPTLFEYMFAQSVPVAANFDRVITAPMPAYPIAPTAAQGLAVVKGKSGKAASGGSKDDSETRDSANISPLLLSLLCQHASWPAAVAAAAESVLSLALGDRVQSVRVVPVTPADGDGNAQIWPCPVPSAFTWALGSPAPAPTCLWICITVNTETSSRLVDRGPAPDDAVKAQAFLDLWGSPSAVSPGTPSPPPIGRGLAELRRFADGALVYAVFWDSARLGGRAYARESIIPLTVAHILTRHCGVSMPVGALHAGEALILSRAGGGKHDGREAGRAVLYADVAQACPSLAVERALDMGQTCAKSVRVTYGGPGKVGGASAHGGPHSAVTGIPTALMSWTAGCTVNGLTSEASALPPAPGEADADPVGRGPVSAVASARAALDYLHAALRSLPGIPLAVSSLDPVSPGLRYTAVHPPAPHPLATGKDSTAVDEGKAASATTAAAGQVKPLTSRALLAIASSACAGSDSTAKDEGHVACQTVVVHEIIVSLEASSRWPSDLPALAALKTAFYLKIKYGLAASGGGLCTANAHREHLDVLVGGYAFRLVLRIDREIELLATVAGRAPLAKSHGRKRANATAVKEDEDEDFDGEGEDTAEPRAKRRVVGFINVAATGATSLEAAPRLAERKAVAARKGVPASLVTQGPMGKVEMAARVKQVFGRGVGVNTLQAAEGTGRVTATAAAATLDALYIQCVCRPRHAASVHALASRFPAYGPAVRLACMWLSSHMLGPEQGYASGSASASEGAGNCLSNREAYIQGRGPPVPQEAVELLIARIFVAPAPYSSPPGSPGPAFLRFLRLLITWDWVREPMLVDVDGSATASDVRTLASRFKQVRSGSDGSGVAASDTSADVSLRFPPLPDTPEPHGPALFIVTPAERGGWRPIWTRAAPSWPVMGRLLAVAVAAEAVLSSSFCPVLAPQAAAASSVSPAALPPSVFGYPGGTRLHSLLDTGVGAAALPSMFTCDTSAYSVLVNIHTADFIPRGFLDGRAAGPVKAPLLCAMALANAPALAAEAAEAHAVDAPGKSALLTLSLGVSQDTSRYTLPLFRNLLPTSRAALLVGFDPVACLARSVRSALGGAAVVCVDSLGGAALGIVWKPGTFLVAGRDKVKQTQALQLQAQMLPALNAVAEAGSGMVRMIQLQ